MFSSDGGHFRGYRSLSEIYLYGDGDGVRVQVPQNLEIYRRYSIKYLSENEALRPRLDVREGIDLFFHLSVVFVK